MGLRLMTTYPDFHNEVTMTVLIYDDDYTGGSVVHFGLVGGGRVVYDVPKGEGDDIWEGRIKPLNATFEMDCDVQAHVDFYKDLARSREGRFWVEVFEGATRRFVGDIAIEQISIAQRHLSIGQPLKITAVDGIKRLQDVPYSHAAALSYVRQDVDGRFRARHGFPNGLLAKNNTNLEVFTIEEYDYGNHFSTAGGHAAVGSRTYVAHYDILGRLSANYFNGSVNLLDIGPRNGSEGFKMTLRLYKIDVNSAEVDLVDPVDVRFNFADETSLFTDSRVRETLTAEDVELVAGESVHTSITYDQDSNLVLGGAFSAAAPIVHYYFDDACYFESQVDAAQAVQVHTDSILTHLIQLLSHLSTYRRYSDGVPFLYIGLFHVESTQGTATGHEHHGLPYNGMVEDYLASPPVAVSCWDVLSDIALLYGGEITYRSGAYYLLPLHDQKTRWCYSKTGTFLSLSTPELAGDPVMCMGPTYLSFLRPARAVRVSYNRLSSLNLVESLVGSFPPSIVYGDVRDGVVSTASVAMPDKVHRLQITIRVKERWDLVLLDLKNDKKRWRHAFKMLLKAGSNYAKSENINSFKAAAPIYADSEWTAVSADRIDIVGPVQRDIKEHLVEVSVDLPAMAYTGPLEVALYYDRTYVAHPQQPSNNVQLNRFEWSVDKMRLSTLDAAKDTELYSAKVVSEVVSEHNTRVMSYDLRFSDQWDIESDPGGIRVWDGAEWVRPQGYQGGASLQEWVARRLANPYVLPSEVLHGRYAYDEFATGHIQPEEEEYWILLSGSYDTKLREIKGKWIRHQVSERWLLLSTATFIEVGDGSSASTRKVGAVSGGSTPDGDDGGGSAGGGGGALSPEQYQHFVTGLSSARVAMPSTVRLPDPANYAPAELMRMFDGSKRGSGNLVYRSTPSHPSHFSIDFVAGEIVLFEPCRATDELFFMWELY